MSKDYYTGRSGQQVKDVCADFGLEEGYKMQALQYILRAGKKPGVTEKEDISKAIDMLCFRLAYLIFIESKESQ